MASIQSQFFNLFLRAARVKKVITKSMITGVGEHEPLPAAFSKKFDVVHNGEEGRGYYVLKRKGKAQKTRNENAVFYLHGGAYISGLMGYHYSFIKDLLDDTVSEACIVDYPVARLEKAKECINFTLDVFQQYTEEKTPGAVTVMGDSAGGGLALSIGQELRDIGVQPKSYQLLSPWLDLSMSHPVPKSQARKDRILDVDALIAAGNHYRGDLEANDPLISPAFADLRGLAPMQMFMGGHEVFLEDGRRFAARAAEAQVELEYHEYAQMQHTWQFLPIPEAKASKQAIKKFLLDG